MSIGESSGSCGKYPQKPIWGLAGDGRRYLVSTGMYCSVCGFPADETKSYVKRGACDTCAAEFRLSASEKIDREAIAAGIELQQMAIVREALQYAVSRG